MNPASSRYANPPMVEKSGRRRAARTRSGRAPGPARRRARAVRRPARVRSGRPPAAASPTSRRTPRRAIHAPERSEIVASPAVEIENPGLAPNGARGEIVDDRLQETLAKRVPGVLRAEIGVVIRPGIPADRRRRRRAQGIKGNIGHDDHREHSACVAGKLPEMLCVQASHPGQGNVGLRGGTPGRVREHALQGRFGAGRERLSPRLDAGGGAGARGGGVRLLRVRGDAHHVPGALHGDGAGGLDDTDAGPRSVARGGAGRDGVADARAGGGPLPGGDGGGGGGGRPRRHAGRHCVPGADRARQRGGRLCDHRLPRVRALPGRGGAQRGARSPDDGRRARRAGAAPTIGALGAGVLIGTTISAAAAFVLLAAAIV